MSSMCVAAAPAVAAKPVKGARYVGESDNPHTGIRDLGLQVSGDGRSFSSRRRGWDKETGGSYMDFDADCSGQSTETIHEDLSSSVGRHVRIRRDGRFSFATDRGAYSFHLRGKFTSRRSLRISFRWRTREPGVGRCHERGVLHAHHIPRPRFTGCRSQRAPTLLRGPTGRIYRQQWKGYDLEATNWVWGCLYSTNRRFALDSTVADDSNYGFRLAGPFEAHVHEYCPGMGPCSDQARVDDLRNGNTVRAVDDLTDIPTDSPGVEDIDLKANNSFAWIASVGSSPKTFEVRVLDRLGLRTVDSGTAIGPHSLSLSGSTLTWLKDGVVRSATLY